MTAPQPPLSYILPNDGFQALDALLHSLPNEAAREMIVTPIEHTEPLEVTYWIMLAEPFTTEATLIIQAACAALGLKRMA